MARRIWLLAGAVGLAVFVAACGASGGGGGGGTASPPRSSGQPSPTMTTPKIGEAFNYTEQFSNGTTGTTWKITVRNIQTGIMSIPNAASNPEYGSSEHPDAPEYVDATPAPGMEFARVDATMANVGQKPGRAPDFDNLVTQQGEFAAKTTDEEYSDNLRTESVPRANDTVNPQQAVQQVQIYTVPANSKAVAVLFPRTWIGGGPTYRIEVK